MVCKRFEDSWRKLLHFEGVSLGVLGDDVFDGDVGLFCSFGTEFDSPYEIYVVHVWQLLYRIGAVLV